MAFRSGGVNLNKIKTNKSILFNRGSKELIASLLSDTKNKIIFTKNDLNTIIYKLDKKEIIFYENKKQRKDTKESRKTILLKNIESLPMYENQERLH